MSERGRAALTGATWHRFVSPHYDDIALSCGGTVALLAAAGATPEIAVVFGDDPDPTTALSPFARAMHDGWGLSTGQVIASRQREETLAAAAMGATSTVLPFLDAIYRGRHYESDDQLFGETAPAESHFPAWIVSALVSDAPPDPRVRIYAPLAVGGHVDHRHAFAVGTELARAGWDVWFYEDLPYALRHQALDARRGALGPRWRLEPAAVVEIDPVWATKLTAILAYGSQLTTVFGYVETAGRPEEIDAIMRGYAVVVGSGVPAERFWRLDEGVG